MAAGSQPAPVRQTIADANGLVTRPWLQWFQLIQLQAQTQADAAGDLATLAATADAAAGAETSSEEQRFLEALAARPRRRMQRLPAPPAATSAAATRTRLLNRLRAISRC